MKTKFTFLILNFLFLFIPDVYSQCTTGSLFPLATFTPLCTGSPEIIATNYQTGQYSNINVLSNKHYTFNGSQLQDFITITNENGSIIYGTGRAPLNWASGTISGVIRFYLHKDYFCATDSTVRTKLVTCSSVGACAWPTSLSAINITSNSAYISWSPSPAPRHEVFYSSLQYSSPISSSQPDGISLTNNCLLNELFPNTTYYYWVRSVCGNVVSPWVSGGTFKTLSEINLSCNGAFYGVNPQTTFTPACTGNNELITSQSAAGQFTNINLSSDKKYIFRSDIGTDYLTITNAAGTAVLAKGSSPLTWYSGATSGGARYYLHSQVACGISSSNRSKFISCIAVCDAPTALANLLQSSTSARLYWDGSASSFQTYFSTVNAAPADNYPTNLNITANKFINLTNLTSATTYYFWVRSVCGGTLSPWVIGGSFTTIAGCSAGSLNPNNTFTPACTGATEIITTTARAGQYAQINILAGKDYTFGSSNASDFITITNIERTVTYAIGTTPLTWSSGTLTGAINYYIHTNSTCGTQAINRTRTIKCCTSTATPIFTPIAPVCFGEVLNALPINSNNGINGNWSPDLNNNNTTTYLFTPNSGQCATTTTLTIEVNSPINNSITLNDTTLAASFSTGTYQWYRCESIPVLIQGAISQSYTPTQNGSYYVQINASGCSTISSCLEVNSLINESFSNSIDLKIYPNPSQGQFVVETKDDIPKQIKILDNIGRIIKTFNVITNKNIIDIKEFSDGIYYLKIISQKEQQTLKKIVLKK